MWTRKFRALLVTLLLLGWFLSGWPVIWQNPRIPPDIKKTKAASGDVILLWDTANGAVPAGWTCISCNPGEAFYGVLPRAAGSYSASTAGDDTHTQTLTYSSATQGSNGTAKGANTGSKALLNTHTHTWGNITTGSGDVRPPFKNLNFIYKNNPTTIPANVIAIFDTSSLPSGWTRYTALDGNYLRGYSDNASGGSSTHLHTVSASAVTSGNAAKPLSDSGSSGAASTDLAHALPASDTNLASVNNAPQYLEVVFAYNSSGSDTSIPDGLIAMFDTAPSINWSSISGASPWQNSFLKGASAYGGTGGSNVDHNHSGSIDLISDQSSSQLTSLGTTGTYIGAHSTHSHTITYTINSVGSLPVYRDTIFAKYTAPIVSVAISPAGDISYGNVGGGQSKSTIDLSATKTATNDGDATEDLNIKTSNATGGTGWTLGYPAGTNTFVYEFSTNNGGDWTRFNTADIYQTLAVGITAAGTQDFDLRITAPTSSDSTEKTITVTIQAISPP